MSSHDIDLYGWTALPRHPYFILRGHSSAKAIEPVPITNIPLPETELAKQVMAYAQKELRKQTYNHSMRVYYYGQAIRQQQFPDWGVSDETYLLTCLLHDIGTTDKNLNTTRLSFEFYGGMLAHNLLHQNLHAPISQAEAVTEAIIRHQDIGTTGKITTLGQLIQLATIFDNLGWHQELVHQETIEDVIKHYPRKGWSGCFAATIRKENGLKPWAHTTALGEEKFPRDVENNTLMAPYDTWEGKTPNKM